VSLEIREERASDIDAVRGVVESAFGRAAEADLVDRLRVDALRISSIVAIERNRVVGHAMFSRVWIDDADATIAVASLAPVAVRPDRQRGGIGSALIARGIDACRAAAWPAVIVVGHTAYYPRFGFSAAPVAHLDTPYRGDHFMGLDLQPGALTRLRGRVRYPAAFLP
jgi:putative acetyltransferase